MVRCPRLPSLPIGGTSEYRKVEHMNRDAANTIKGRLITIEESLKNVETNVFCLKNFADILDEGQARQMFLNMERDLINAWQAVNDQFDEPAPGETAEEYDQRINGEPAPDVMITLTESGEEFMRDRDPIEIPPMPVLGDEEQAYYGTNY